MTLGFYDHHRQDYHDATVDLLWADEPSLMGEFMVGGYGRQCGVDERGEFKIVLRKFTPSDPMAVQVCVFGDSWGAFREADDAGLSEAIEATDIRCRDDFSRLLTGLGLVDRSHRKLVAGGRLR